jgi:hypothetical protein
MTDSNGIETMNEQPKADGAFRTVRGAEFLEFALARNCLRKTDDPSQMITASVASWNTFVKSTMKKD